MVKLFLKNSNLCDHNSPTSQTDRQTDRQTTCNRNTALCTKVHRAVKTPLAYKQLFHRPIQVSIRQSSKRQQQKHHRKPISDHASTGSVDCRCGGHRRI